MIRFNRKKQPKYRNIKTVVDGITFDSMKEAKRYRELKLLERTGLICNLELQPSYPISRGGVKDPATGRRMVARKYIADFQYLENGIMVVEDVKSISTAKDSTYRLKRQLFIEQYGDKYKFIER
ncbi:MAG: hypothetical protein DRP56_02810 [Planctomycetota bacterium]|nr:MAG: hypothetical protein DRP56_02810 [Planctomycetota bacterium]